MSYGLPVDAALGPLMAALAAERAAVLEAPTGAGKSTLVPLELLKEDWHRPQDRDARTAPAGHPRGRRTHGAQPRRGRRQRVGYRMRLDTRVSRATRIEVVTEGVLTRLLQEDPALEGVAAVIFDEYHERSLQADLGLALALDAGPTWMPGLRLLVMSATLDGEPWRA